MSSERFSKSLLKLDQNSFLQPRMILREEQDPIQVRIKVKKPSKAKSKERPVCFRVKDGRPVDPLSVCAPLRKSSKPCYSEPAYEVAPIIYINADGTPKGCPPVGNESIGASAAETLKDPDCGCPVKSSIEKTFTPNGSEDEPLVIKISPSDFSSNGCEEKPVYKINFKDNVMNVTSNIDFLVKKMEKTQSTVENDPDVQKYLIKPISNNFPPVIVTVRPNPLGDQSVSVDDDGSEEIANTKNQSVPNEYAERPTQSVQQPPAATQQQVYTPEQLAAAYQQQQVVVSPQQAAVYQQPQQAAVYQQPQQAVAYQQQSGAVPPQILIQAQAAQQAVAAAQQGNFTPEQIMAAVREQQASNPGAIQFTPEQLASAYQEQQSGQAEFKVTPEQLAAAYKEQQAANPGAPQYQFTPEQLTAAYQQQGGAVQQQAAAATQYPQQVAYPQQQAAAATQYPQQVAYPQQQAAAATQYPQQVAYPQQQAAAATQYPQQVAYPQQQAAAATQYPQQNAQQPFQFSQFPPQVAA